MVPTILYHVKDMDTGQEAIAGSKQEAREQLKAIIRGALNVRSGRIKTRRRRQPKPKGQTADQ